MTLRHLVFIDVVDNQKKIAAVEESLKKLSLSVQGCLGFHFDKCDEPSSYHYFFMDFDNEASRDKYLVNPEHEKAVKEVIVPSLKDGLKSVVVFDYEKNERKKISALKKAPETTGYILIKHGQEESVLNELIQHCEKINRAKPLMNRTVESFGKDYPYAMQLILKPGMSPVYPKDAVSFWGRKAELPQEKEVSQMLTPVPETIITSKL